MKYIKISKFSLFLLVFLLTSCWQKQIWDKSTESIDEIAPGLNSVVPLSNLSLELVFSEQVDETSAENPLNYTIPGLTVTDAVRDDINYSIVRLTTGSQQNMEYELTVNNVLDEFINEIDPAQNALRFFGDALPEVISAFPINNALVKVDFSEDIEHTSAEDIGNYLIMDRASQTIEIKVLSASHVMNNQVELVTESHPNNQVYILSVIGVEDVTGNPIDLWDTIQNPDPSKKEAVFNGDALPYVSAVYPTNNDHIKVVFSEPVTFADQLSNYYVDILPIYSLIPVSSTVFEIQTDLQSTLIYNLTVRNIQDSAFNIVDPSVQYAFTGDAVPYLMSAIALSSTQIQIIFSEPVEITSAELASNYNFIGSPTIMVDYITRLSSPNGNIVNIFLLTSCSGSYDVTVTGVVDEDNGNMIGVPNTMNFNWP